jgi:uncharacterized membrane protein YbaN (DUF454 family)
MKRIILLALGGISLLLAGIGAVLPVLPTTPFVLLSAGFFSSSSPRLYRKLAETRYFGEYVRNYKEKTGISRKTRVIGLCWLWGTLIVSALIGRNVRIWIILLAVGIAVSIHILTIRRKKGDNKGQ